MVKVLFFLCLYFAAALSLLGSPVIDSSIDSANTYAHFPIDGTLSITHSRSEKIDEHSFFIGKEPLAVSLIKDVQMPAPSNTLVSLYSFQLPAKEPGVYELPKISVLIGGKEFSSAAVFFEVQAGAKRTLSPTVSQQPLIFRLEGFVEGSQTLYPGQRTLLSYKISFNRSVDLSRSTLPMVHPDHLQKIGDVRIEETERGDITEQKITQEVEATQIGIFSFGPSAIEGYAYKMEGEKKVYEGALLKAEAPPVTIEVKPFPSSSKPSSFNGAVGSIAVHTALRSPSTTFKVGENIDWRIEINGIENVSNFNLPSIQCQPGWNGFFRIEDEPPLAETIEDKKVFYLSCRPMTSLIQALPSIQVSSFDPHKNIFIVQKSEPIAITVAERPPLPLAEDLIPVQERDKWVAAREPLEALQILKSSSPLASCNTTKSTQARRMNWVLLAIGLLALQLAWSRFWK